ncbi:MAG: phosphatase [Actinomycetota bacterium]|nr:phosphatase [Actinomycetota bacterium]
MDMTAALVASRLTGDVATPPSSTLGNAQKLADGHIDYTFGFSFDVSAEEAVAAVTAICGADPRRLPEDGPGRIEPHTTIAAIERHRSSLAAAADGGAQVLVATGHPTGLLAHYGAVARALDSAGCELLTPLDDVRDLMEQGDHKLGVRYLDAVAVAWSGGELYHTHRSGLMEACLDALDPIEPDLVIADHGWAGAAIERGIETLSIADVNDPALMVAQVRGMTDAVLPIDDNLAPRHFRPVTRALLDGLD